MSEAFHFNRALNILAVEDNPDDAELCLQTIKRAGLEARVELVQTAHEFCAAIASRDYQLVLADNNLPSFSGSEAIELLRQMDKEIPVILLTGALRDEEAVEVLKHGAVDYVAKDRMAALPIAIRRALDTFAARKRTMELERRLREAEESCARLAELSPDPHLIESDGIIVYANAAAARLLGAESEGQLLRKPAAQIWHADSRATLGQTFTELLATRTPVACEARVLRMDGKAVEVKIAAAAVIYHGKPAVQIGIRDVTDRRLVEAAIKSLSALAESNPYPVFAFSRDGKLAYSNAAATELARAMGKDHASGIIPSDAALIVQTCLSTGQKKSDIEVTSGGRTLVWTFLPTQQNQAVHAYAVDVTERQNLQAQLRHAQRLEATGRLAAGIAHDFSNILTVIQGHAGLLSSEPNLRPEMRESLQQVLRATERAARLTNQLLTFSRKGPAEPRPIDLNEVLAEMSALLHRTIGEDVEFEFKYEPQLPMIYADPRLIEQCVLNIVVNAREGMPAGGQLLISTGVTEVDAAHVVHHPDAEAGRFVCLTIVDSGGGAPTASMQRDAEPGASGLGLTMVNSIVKQHNGWIEAQTRAGQGSGFRIYFPIHNGASERVRPHRRNEQVVCRETVLLVEDEAPVRSIIRAMLERHGMEVLEAGSGIEALAVWHQHHDRIRLLLTDVVMPAGLSGQELAEKFRAQKPDLKVLFTSGYSPGAAGSGLTAEEGTVFLQKPFDGTKLGETVRRCLEGA